METTGKVTGNWWDETKVGPWFNGWRMREGASKELGNMSYSYGYVVRMEGSENAREERRTIIKRSTDTRKPIDGKLTLIETKLKSRGTRGVNYLVGKKQLDGFVGGFTKKKFFLIGVGENSKEIEFKALISIVEGATNGSAKCLKEVMEGSLVNKENMQNFKKEFSESGLFWPADMQRGRLTLAGQMAFGNCAKEFYKDKKSSELKVVEELKKENEASIRIGLQELNIEGGMSIAAGAGIKKNNSLGSPEDIISPGILIKNNTTGGRTLWAGLRGDGKVTKTHSSTQDNGQGVVVLHDWISTSTKYSTSSIRSIRSSSEDNFDFAKISLNGKRKYYLWDPSYTEIKNGKLVTIDDQEIPWKINISLPFSSSLVK